MKKNVLALFIGLATILYCNEMLYAQKNKDANKKSVHTFFSNGSQLTPLSNDESTAKIIKRSEIESEGYNFAKQGFFDRALEKYSEAMQPALLNQESDKSTALWAIRDIHQRQGKLGLALKEHEWFLNANPTKDEYLDKKYELEALVKGHDTNSNQPVYDHINFLRTKYKKYVPPKSKGDSGFHWWPINNIIHLYDWMGDADGGIKFMNEVLSSHSLYPNERKEYELVKAAFEEDKTTGKKGHLQKVIETSNIIGW